MKKTHLVGASCAIVLATCLPISAYANLGDWLGYETLHLRDFDPDTGVWSAVTCVEGGHCTLSGTETPVNLADTEAVYDEILDITWLRSLPGEKNTKANADGYIQLLNIAEGYFGITSWRLPNIEPIDGLTYNTPQSCDGSTDRGYNIISENSELSHLYYVTLDGKSYYESSESCSVAPQAGFADLGNAPSLFSGLQAGAAFNSTYWSGSSDSDGNLWVFDFYFGNQFSFTDSNSAFFVWPVTDGDVLNPPSPSEQLEDLIATVISINLEADIPFTNGLDGKLDNALKALEDMNSKNDVAAVNMLHAFIHSVEAQRWNLEEAGIDADALIAAAQAIIDSLGGS